MAQYHRHYPRNKIPLSVTLEAWLMVASIVATILLIKTDIIARLLVHAQAYDVLASFVSGF
ncbi:MAG TPA: hypothetical protein VHD38_00610, partial [Candidatus Paceibacterota bacterium]|nr:hypothetical protein [Candidatus Paceibacterota bacterium]